MIASNLKNRIKVLDSLNKEISLTKEDYKYVNIISIYIKIWGFSFKTTY